MVSIDIACFISFYKKQGNTGNHQFSQGLNNTLPFLDSKIKNNLSSINSLNITAQSRSKDPGNNSKVPTSKNNILDWREHSWSVRIRFLFLEPVALNTEPRPIL